MIFQPTLLRSAMKIIVGDQTRILEQFESRMKALDPLAVLQRGYSLVTDQQGALINNSKLVSKGDLINIQLAKGKLKAEVSRTSQEE